VCVFSFALNCKECIRFGLLVSVFIFEAIFLVDHKISFDGFVIVIITPYGLIYGQSISIIIIHEWVV